MILHLIETGGPGGAEQMLLRLAEEYGRRGFSQMVCLRKDGWLASEVRRRDLDLKIEPLKKLPDFGWLWRLNKLARKSGVTAIHAHEFVMNVRGTILGRWLGIPVVATVHGRGYYGDKFVRRQAYRLTSRSANLIAVSEDIRQQLIKKCGVKPHRVSVVLNGVDTDTFRFNGGKRRIFRELFDVKPEQLLLGTVGSYYQVKGHRYLIEALKILVDRNLDLKLVMAGQGPLEDELRKLAESTGIGEYVNVAGYIEDTSGFLSALDVFVMPSLSEGIPLALLEAAACNCCIVATNVGGIPEVIANQESGILVPPGNAEALAEALAGLLDQDWRKILAANAAERVKKDWSMQRTAGRYLEFLFPGLSRGNPVQ